MIDYLQDAQRRDIHRVLVEKALGKPLPKRAEVHHIDSDRRNNDPSNLVLCHNHEYHMLLHRRQRAMDLGFNLETQGYCCACKQIKGKESFYGNKARPDGIGEKCKLCSIEYSKSWAKRNRTRRNDKRRESNALRVVR